ncbi:MAG: phosphoribosylamine--glycine ligase, partial [Candidatus Micrarchaeota archaeon]
MSNKVLLIGAGAREHAIAKAVCCSKNAELYAVTKNNNPGITALAKKVFHRDETEAVFVSEIAKNEGIDIAIVGPEAPLAAGVADALELMKIPCFGPKQSLARLETSKAFTRDLLAKYGIPGNPEFRKFASSEASEITNYAQALLDKFGGFVVKPDGLTGGKGVKVSGEHLASPKDAEDYAKDIFASKHESVIVEEKLEGEEFSLQAFSGGGRNASTPLVHDHKRAFENDVGEQTGGMGSYSMPDHSRPFVTPAEVEQALVSNALVARA